MDKPQEPKEQNLVKGALRRVFARSSLRRSIIEESVVKDYKDPRRPRVTRWSVCVACSHIKPTYQFQVDHIDPVVPIDKVLKDMTWDEVVESIWCDKSNLVAICKTCHIDKTKGEMKARRAYKKRMKDERESLQKRLDNFRSSHAVSSSRRRSIPKGS